MLVKILSVCYFLLPVSFIFLSVHQSFLYVTYHVSPTDFILGFPCVTIYQKNHKYTDLFLGIPYVTVTHRWTEIFGTPLAKFTKLYTFGFYILPLHWPISCCPPPPHTRRSAQTGWQYPAGSSQCPCWPPASTPA